MTSRSLALARLRRHREVFLEPRSPQRRQALSPPRGSRHGFELLSSGGWFRGNPSTGRPGGEPPSRWSSYLPKFHRRKPFSAAESRIPKRVVPHVVVLGKDVEHIDDPHRAPCEPTVVRQPGIRTEVDVAGFDVHTQRILLGLLSDRSLSGRGQYDSKCSRLVFFRANQHPLLSASGSKGAWISTGDSRLVDAPRRR